MDDKVGLYDRTIASWPEDDRPREKLLKRGAQTLSNAELLAILIRTGVKGASAVDLARELLRRFKTLRQMGSADVADVDEGDVAGTRPSIRKMMLRAAQSYAAGLIAVHNHPSGDPTPSEQDKLLTRDLVVAGRALEIRLFDHLVIGDGRYFSFADEGWIEEYERLTLIMNKGE